MDDQSASRMVRPLHKFAGMEMAPTRQPLSLCTKSKTLSRDYSEKNEQEQDGF
jgi:hypothetical protein